MIMFSISSSTARPAITRMFLRTIQTESHPIPSDVSASSGGSKLLEVAHEDALRKIDELTKDRDFFKEKYQQQSTYVAEIRRDNMRLEEQVEKQASKGVGKKPKRESRRALPGPIPKAYNCGDDPTRPHLFTITIPPGKFGDLSQLVGDVDYSEMEREIAEGGINKEKMKKFFVHLGFSQEYVDSLNL